MDLYAYDRSVGVECLCGVDEAGRGPLAGDVYAAACILPLEAEIEGLNDSKKLSEKKREMLYDEITQKATAWAVGTATVEEIDRLNILQATFLAMRRAVEGLSIPPTLVLVDGNQNPHLPIHSRCVIKGDATSASIAAASILAKVSRDRYMKQLAETYPQYQFEKHKGYGTKLHYEMLAAYGPSDCHRKTFLRSFYADQTAHTESAGSRGEAAAKAYLEDRGFRILEHNYRAAGGEIDLIAANGDLLAFVEVKTRNPNSIYEPCEAVGPKKQKRIIQTALAFLAAYPVFSQKQLRFDVAEVFTSRGKKADVKEIRYIENAFTAEQNGSA